MKMLKKNKLFNEQNVLLKRISSVNDGVYNFLNNIKKK